jgi:hypothetical protein
MRFRRYRVCPGSALITAALVCPMPGQQPPSQAHKAAHPNSSTAEMGELRNGIYRNPYFGFTCKVPYGWVERTAQMRDPDDSGKSLLLLAIFERPPEVTGSTINSAVVIAAEKISAYSGLKTAADYLGPIHELATNKGFHAEGDAYEFPAGQRPLARADFSKPRGSLTMYQTSLVTLERGYALSFTFIGGGKDEIEELIENLNFAAKSN